MTCDDCNGAGGIDTDIQFADIPANHKHHKELGELKDDIGRINRDASHLCSLNPSRSESYIAQQKAAISEVCKEAEKIWGMK